MRQNKAVVTCFKCKKKRYCPYKGPTCTYCYQKGRPIDVAKRKERISRNVRTLTGQYNYAKAQAKKRGITWNLTKEEFTTARVGKACFYCSGPLPEVGVGLDRLDNNKEIGYAAHNIIPCCGDCNQLRGNRLTVQETLAAVLSVKDFKQKILVDYFEHGIHLDLRTISIHGEITPDLASATLKAIDELEKINQNLTIHLSIMSEGGDWPSALAIYDRLLNCKCPIVAIGTGLVASSASVILQAADQRLLTPNASFMVHDGTEGYEGHARNLEAWAQHSKGSRQTMYEIYAERSGKSVSYWSKRCIVDYVLNAREAVEEGLADSVWKSPKDKKA